jgi:hypothetical protein
MGYKESAFYRGSDLLKPFLKRWLILQVTIADGMDLD